MSPKRIVAAYSIKEAFPAAGTPLLVTDNARETAQLVERDAPRFDLGAPRLLVAHVLGEPTERGFAFRALRLATAEDVAALGPAT